jgi:transcriptional regulator with XRE-family HTH domain
MSAPSLSVSFWLCAGEGKIVFEHLDPSMKTKLVTTRLRHLRDEAKLTQKQVAEEADWSINKMLRIESGENHVSTSDLNTLLDIYQVSDPEQRKSMRELARGARQRSWTHQYRGALNDVFVRYLGYESSAERLLKTEALMVPGLLQTEDYARALLASIVPFDNPSPAEVELQVKARLTRQETLFSGPGRPDLAFILDESVLLRPRGGVEVMCAQLWHLKEMAQQDGITIQVVPIAVASTDISMAPFTVLEFDDAADPMLFIETPRHTMLEYEGEVVERYRNQFRRMSETATRPEDFGKVADAAIAALQHDSVGILPVN